MSKWGKLQAATKQVKQAEAKDADSTVKSLVTEGDAAVLPERKKSMKIDLNELVQERMTREKQATAELEKGKKCY